MNWFEPFLKAQKELQQQPKKERPIEAKCPECGGDALIWILREGRNKGRPRLVCKDEVSCKLVKFMDLPLCDYCGTEKFESMVMGGKNKGRFYHACPNRCPGSFRWCHSYKERG